MDIDNVKKVYLLGIGGIGMSALAEYFHAIGANVSGYDRVSTPITDRLMNMGISIHFKEDIKQVPIDADLYIYTPAIPEDHIEYSYCEEKRFPLLKRSQVLSEITKGKKTVAVAGTHGKTTISAMLTHVLTQANQKCLAFVGGVMRNYNSNFVYHEDADLVVVEADEYDRSFLRLLPSLAIITAVDSDHMDIYGTHEILKKTFKDFSNQVKSQLIVNQSTEEIFPQHKQTYSISHLADFSAENLKIHNGGYLFEVAYKGENLGTFQLNIGGKHNVENALATIAACVSLEIPISDIQQAIQSFKGVKRRFEYVFKTEDIIYIDDYAHHPVEIEYLLKGVHELYPSKRITAIFQPHLYSRTRDYAGEFAQSLSIADEVILLDIYPAREKPIEGITSQLIRKNITVTSSLMKKLDVLEYVRNKKIEVLVTIGAGDIDSYAETIKNILMDKKAAELDQLLDTL